MTWSRRGNSLFGWGFDQMEEPWCPPRFAPARSLVDNAHRLTRPLWGKARAEWAMWLAGDLVAELPEAEGAAKHEW